jgi:hypothetical protein
MRESRGYRAARCAKRFVAFADLPEEAAFRRSHTHYGVGEAAEGSQGAPAEPARRAEGAQEPRPPRVRKERLPNPPAVPKLRKSDERAVRDAARIGGSPSCPHATRVADRSQRSPRSRARLA